MIDEIILLQKAVEKAIGKKDSALRREVAGLMREGWIDLEVALEALPPPHPSRQGFIYPPRTKESARPAGKLAGMAVKRATGKGPGQDWTGERRSLGRRQRRVQVGWTSSLRPC